MMRITGNVKLNRTQDGETVLVVVSFSSESEFAVVVQPRGDIDRGEHWRHRGQPNRSVVRRHGPILTDAPGNRPECARQGQTSSPNAGPRTAAPHRRSRASGQERSRCAYRRLCVMPDERAVCVLLTTRTPAIRLPHLRETRGRRDHGNPMGAHFHEEPPRLERCGLEPIARHVTS